MITEPNPDVPNQSLIKIQVRDVPDNIVLTIADALFNLRSALDLLACGLPRIEGASDRGIYFPICDSEAEFNSPEPQRKIRKLTTESRAFIATCKPYKGGDDNLYFLHRLNIRDKHKSLIPSVANIGVPTSVKHEGANPATILTPNLWNPADNTVTVASVGPDVNTEIKMPVSVALNEPGVFEGEPIYLVLLKLAETVGRIVENANREFYPTHERRTELAIFTPPGPAKS